MKTYNYYGTEIFLEFQKEKGKIIAIKFIDKYNGLIILSTLTSLYIEDFNSIAVKNYSENRGVLEFLIKNKIVEKPHRSIQSGYVEIPICKLLIKPE